MTRADCGVVYYECCIGMFPTYNVGVFFFSLESKWPVGLIRSSFFSSMATTMEDESGVLTSFT